MNVHFIAIGGAAMHNLALALKKKGYSVSGSDDEIFEPSRGRLESAGLLPEKFGWYPEKLTSEIDVVILGMHARKDNLELIRAQEMGLKIYSYPEFLFEQTKNKKRIVIGGSHGKTTITSMVMHVLKELKVSFDYMVGSQIDGFETMVSLNEITEIAVFEGDEYLSSPIDLRPKFHLYFPHIALINGIAWDHINVFPTYENYKEQFKLFIDKIVPSGSLFYNVFDSETSKLVEEVNRTDITTKAYEKLDYKVVDEVCVLKRENGSEVKLQIFGMHNIENLAGAKAVCNSLAISDDDFFEAIASFKGSKKRMQQLYKDSKSTVFLDFAHAPSKVKASVKAVREQFGGQRIVACLELHTFSSLNKKFIGDYAHSLDAVDEAIVFYNPQVVEHKKLPPISPEELKQAFKRTDIKIVTTKDELTATVKHNATTSNTIYMFMSSGNFGGMSHSDMIACANNE